MKLYDIHPVYSEQIEFLRAKSKELSLWKDEAAAVVRSGDVEFQSADVALETLLGLQRIHMVFTAGVENDAAFRCAHDEQTFLTWKDFQHLPVEENLENQVAALLFNADPVKNDQSFITLSPMTKRIGVSLLNKALASGVPAVIRFDDQPFERLIMQYAQDNGIAALAERIVYLAGQCSTLISARCGELGLQAVDVDVAKLRKYEAGLKPYNQRISTGDVWWRLTHLPTPADADIDGMRYADYAKLFCEMCDQPWSHIDVAQQHLIGKLDQGKQLKLTNKDGTELHMNVDGFTFCNSLIARNVPGSEAFSAPHKNSVNGRIVSKGKFSRAGGIIENITLDFKDGELISWKAEKGQGFLDKAVSLDEGMKYVGEIGFGTNPHLRRHVVNSLLVEKVGGSFHVALGNAYQMTHYLGTPVKVDNGNRSLGHWDITTLVDKIELDGELIMDNGLWLDPRLDVLNRGWAAIPRDQRPPYWQDYYDSHSEVAPSRRALATTSTLQGLQHGG